MLKFSEIFEFSKEKFRKIPILKEFEWFEWFEMVRMVRSLADRTFQLWRRRPPLPALTLLMSVAAQNELVGAISTVTSFAATGTTAL